MKYEEDLDSESEVNFKPLWYIMGVTGLCSLLLNFYTIKRDNVERYNVGKPKIKDYKWAEKDLNGDGIKEKFYNIDGEKYFYEIDGKNLEDKFE